MANDEDLDAFSRWERDSWELRAQSYAEALGDLTRGSVSTLLDSAGVVPGSRVLDAGSGPGFVAVEAASRGASVQAVDQSAHMVRIARAAGVDACQASVVALPYDCGAFDCVVAAYLLNHLAQPEVAVAEFGRVLSRGGRLAMTIWDVHTANPAIGLIARVCAEMGLVADVPAGPDPYRFTDRDEVRALLSGWGEVTTSRPRWTVVVEPARWFDAIADSTPRSGAALAQADPATRAAARHRFVELALKEGRVGAVGAMGAMGAVGAVGAVGAGLAELAASAVLITAARD